MDWDCIHCFVLNFVTFFLLVGKKEFRANPGHFSNNKKAGFALSVSNVLWIQKLIRRAEKLLNHYKIEVQFKNNEYRVDYPKPDLSNIPLLPNQSRVSVPLRWRMQGLYCTYSRTYLMYFLNLFSFTDVHIFYFDWRISCWGYYRIFLYSQSTRINYWLS